MRVVNLCTSSGHALYLCQVSWNYLERYQSYWADTISILKITKGNNSAKNVGGVTVVNLCTSSGHALYFYQVLWNYIKRYQSYRADTISILKISKGNNSAKNVGGVRVVNLCTSSDHALYLCQVSWNYLERYQSYGADTNDQPLTDGRTDRRTDGRTDTQKFGGYNIICRHFLWRGIKNQHDSSMLVLYSVRILIMNTTPLSCSHRVSALPNLADLWSRLDEVNMPPLWKKPILVV